MNQTLQLSFSWWLVQTSSFAAFRRPVKWFRREASGEVTRETNLDDFEPQESYHYNPSCQYWSYVSNVSVWSWQQSPVLLHLYAQSYLFTIVTKLFFLYPNDNIMILWERPIQIFFWVFSAIIEDQRPCPHFVPPSSWRAARWVEEDQAAKDLLYNAAQSYCPSFSSILD